MPQERQDRQISLDEWEKMTFERYGVPEGLRRSILGQESADGTRLTSPTGVKGRYQVTEATAQQYGYDRNDVWQQPVAAAKHLRSLYDGIKKRNPGFSDKQAWLGASTEYYFGADAFDKNGNLSQGSRDGFSTPAKYATSIAERWSAFDRGETPQTGATPQPMRQPTPAPPSTPQLPVGQRKLRSVGPRVGQQPAPGSFEEARANVSRLTSQISPEAAALRAEQAPGALRDVANRFLKSAISSAAGIGAGLARFPIGVEPEALYVMQAEAERTGQPNFGSRFATREGRAGLVAEAAKQAVETKAEAARRYPTDPNVQPSYNLLRRGFYQATLPEAAGSLAIPAAAGVLAGPMAPLMSGTIGALQGQGSTYAEAKEAGATDKEARAAADIGALIGTTEVFGFGKILACLGLARPALKRVKEIASEYGQEAAAAWLGNLNASVLSGYDPSRSLNPLDPSVQGPGLVGAVLGGAVQGVDVGSQRLARQRSATAPAQPAAPQPAQPQPVIGHVLCSAEHNGCYVQPRIM